MARLKHKTPSRIYLTRAADRESIAPVADQRMAEEGSDEKSIEDGQATEPGRQMNTLVVSLSAIAMVVQD